jgi:hypothetical protein
LRHARRSPDDRTEEHHGGFRIAAIFVKANPASSVVGQLEVRKALTHFWAGAMARRQAPAAGMTEGCRGFEARFISLDDGQEVLPRNCAIDREPIRLLRAGIHPQAYSNPYEVMGTVALGMPLAEATHNEVDGP